MEPSNHKTRVLLILSLLLFVLSFSFQGVRGIWEPDEGYYIGSAVSMEARQNYLVPTLGQEEIFLDKPPLLYWGILGGLKLFGHSEFAARFSTGLCFALTALVVFAFEVSISRRFDMAFWASVMYATMILPFIAANFVTPDTALTLFTTLSMFCFWQCVRPHADNIGRWLMLLGLTIGLGFLTKGPAALIPCGAMVVYLLLQRQMKPFFLNPWMIPAAIIFITVGLSWYIYIMRKLPDAGGYLFDNMIWGRLVSGKYQRNPDPSDALIYLPVILLGTMPWSVLWNDSKRGLRSFLHGRTWKNVLRDPARTLLTCWILIPLFVLCIASSKLGLYALPIFPAMALATVRLLPVDDSSSTTGYEKPSLVNAPKTSFLTAWVIVLLVIRVVLGTIPSAHDCRALWHELKPHLPPGQYEIVTIDERASGLWFYGAREVENITRRSKPYPTFIPTENIESEILDMAKDNYPHLFLIQGNKYLSSIKRTLLENRWSIKEISLKYDRRLLICKPQSGTFSFVK